MADLRLTRAVSSVTRGTDDDQWMALRGTRDGAAITADWILAHCMEGRVFAANLGTATGPATFGAGSIDTGEFDLHVSVPSGTTVIPISLNIQIEAFGTAGVFECMAIAGTGSTAGSDSTSVTPVNLRVGDTTNTSGCTVVGAATTTSGVAITGVEFFRDGHIKSQTPVTTLLNGSTIATNFNWSVLKTGYAPICVGASQIGVYAAAVGGTGFITLVWVEIPSTAIV